MTQMSSARKGDLSPEMKQILKTERIDQEALLQGVASGTIAIPANINRSLKRPQAIGKGLKTKVNANIGTSPDSSDLALELQKLDAAEKAGADTFMDLSTAGDLDEIRKTLIEHASIPIGTVPIYQARIEVIQSGKGFIDMSVDELFEVLQKHAEDGVDFFTVHCGVTRAAVDALLNEGRLMNIVSRGGSFLVEWMLYHDCENPLYQHYDRLLALAKKYDVTLSLGDGLRPGCLADATDRAMIQELITLGELTNRAWQEDVQVIIEGPGHMPINHIAENVFLEKQLCHGAPFYVLGPIVTDIAPGYDHITAGIGGAIAASAGADFLCYVTPSEHLSLPTVEDVHLGVITTRIAAHAGDIGKGIPGALTQDDAMAKCRQNHDWKGQIALSIDPGKATTRREASLPADEETCSMCGEFCAIKVINRSFREILNR
ncbi:phosphomethylpyrimidine synthase ThiC [candidate division CSSED10-310 bacterium]|uniref:Phosphomethylpyrimidine synthase n=1 Tax=candidate division CSSED10-310 bacterium TaxID=2855610 RepID=A0ABV6Z5P5_UNCC1